MRLPRSHLSCVNTIPIFLAQKNKGIQRIVWVRLLNIGAYVDRSITVFSCGKPLKHVEDRYHVGLQSTCWFATFLMVLYCVKSNCKKISFFSIFIGDGNKLPWNVSNGK